MSGTCFHPGFMMARYVIKTTLKTTTTNVLPSRWERSAFVSIGTSDRLVVTSCASIVGTKTFVGPHWKAKAMRTIVYTCNSAFLLCCGRNVNAFLALYHPSTSKPHIEMGPWEGRWGSERHNCKV